MITKHMFPILHHLTQAFDLCHYLFIPCYSLSSIHAFILEASPAVAALFSVSEVLSKPTPLLFHTS